MPLLTIKEAAQRLGVSYQAVYHAINHGRLASVTLYGKRLVEETDVAAYSVNRRLQAAGKTPKKG